MRIRSASLEIRFDQTPADRDVEHGDVFLTVLESVRECARLGVLAFVITESMMTDDGLATYDRVAYELTYISLLPGCVIIAVSIPGFW